MGNFLKFLASFGILLVFHILYCVAIFKLIFFIKYRKEKEFLEFALLKDDKRKIMREISDGAVKQYTIILITILIFNLIK